MLGGSLGCGGGGSLKGFLGAGEGDGGGGGGGGGGGLGRLCLLGAGEGW